MYCCIGVNNETYRWKKRIYNRARGYAYFAERRVRGCSNNRGISMTRRRILCRTLLLVLIAAVCVAGAGVGAAGEVNVTFEGRFGGATYAVAVSGNYAYIGQGQDFVVFDIRYVFS